MKISLTEMEEIHFYVIVNRKFRDLQFLRKLSQFHNFKVAAAPVVFACSSGSGSAATSLIQVAVAPLLFSSKSGSDSGATI